MMKRNLKWVLVLSALTLALWACERKEEAPKEPAQTTTTQPETSPGTTATQPPGTTAQAPATGTGAEDGKEVYDKTCAACHEEGIQGAPKTGDKEVWSSRLAKGADTLVQSTINGIGTMPPKGGNPALSEQEVRAAVNYMIEKSR